MGLNVSCSLCYLPLNTLFVNLLSSSKIHSAAAQGSVSSLSLLITYLFLSHGEFSVGAVGVIRLQTPQARRHALCAYQAKQFNKALILQAQELPASSEVTRLW